MKKNVGIGILLAFVAVLIASSSAYAKVADCVGDGNLYPNLSTSDGGGAYPVKCPITIAENGRAVPLYGKSAGDCASAGTIATNPDVCNDSYKEELTSADAGKKKDNEEDSLSIRELILICSLCVSATLNIVFIALLVKKSKKSVVTVEASASLAQDTMADIYPTPNKN